MAVPYDGKTVNVLPHDRIAENPNPLHDGPNRPDDGEDDGPDEGSNRQDEDQELNSQDPKPNSQPPEANSQDDESNSQGDVPAHAKVLFCLREIYPMWRELGNSSFRCYFVPSFARASLGARKARQ